MAAMNGVKGNRKYAGDQDVSYHPDWPPVIVASPGRCGSTLLYKTICLHGYQSAPFLARFEDAMLRPGHVYKTHDLPPSQLPKDTKLIYIFANPYDTVISAFMAINEWGRMHHYHMHSDAYQENTSVLRSDTMGLYRHFDSWYRPQCVSMITVKYEHLWDESVKNQMDAYLGFELKLPAYVKRQADYQKGSARQKLQPIYGDLYEKFMNASPVKIWPGGPT